MVACSHQREYRGGERAHARAEDEAALGALERRDGVGQLDVVRVPMARLGPGDATTIATRERSAADGSANVVVWKIGEETGRAGDVARLV